MQSMYATRIGYQLSDPLKLTFLLGVQNSRFNSPQLQPMDFNSLLGGARLDYNPTDNFHLRVEFQNSPYGSVNPWSNRYLNSSHISGQYYHSPWLISENE